MLSEAYTTTQLYGDQPDPEEPLGLSIVIGNSSFTYAVFTQQFKQVIQLCHVHSSPAGLSVSQITEKIPALIQNFLTAPKNYEKVNVAVFNPFFTLLPQAYGQGDSRSLLQFTTGLTAIKNLHQHNIKGIDFCYTLDHDLVSYLEKTFTNGSIRHAGAVTLSLLNSQHSLANCEVFLNLQDTSLELAIQEKDQLLFYNVFTYENNEDVLYYLLFSLEQFGMDPLQTRLCMACQRPVSDDLISAIRKYIRQVSFCVTDPQVKLTGELKQLPQHYYFTLLNQHLCEL